MLQKEYDVTIYLNNKKVPMRVFSGGEVDVNVKGLVAPSGIRKNITAILRSANDLIALMLTVDAIRQIDPEAYISAHIPYLPYARQDRVCNEGEAFSSKVVAQLINSLNLEMVYVDVPHSDVMVDLIKNCESYPFYIDLHSVEWPLGISVMCADEGMFKRNKIILPLSGELLCASKKRDTLTGEITETSFSADVTNRNILVIDDICDGGQTFIELAKALKEKGANKLYLHVAFGIFRFGEEELLKYYEKVGCQFDFRQEEWSML